MFQRVIIVTVSLVLLFACSPREDATGEGVQRDASKEVTLPEVKKETREAWDTSRDYIRNVTADLRDDVENRLDQAGDELRQLKQDTRESGAVRDLESRLEELRQDFNQMRQETRQSAEGTADALRRQWQELKTRVEALSDEIRSHRQNSKKHSENHDVKALMLTA